ncbi:FAD-binding oxidoreductase [Candidatus Saccharibacteria bacterium]|nr:FAD-binding oxidoreductase [Candidatus Saccharibacteria bacterium]
MNKIAIYLNRHLTGNVFDKDSILEAYSTDRSILKIKPRLVALPESTSDVRKLVRFVNQLAVKNYNLPLVVRGSGLDPTGADLTSGLLVSTEKLNKLRELDAHDRLVHVQSGVTLGQLNSVLAPHGLFLPVNADPRETIGSLIASAPTDSFSGKYGGIMNYIDRVEFVLPNGDLVQTSRIFGGKLKSKKKDKKEGALYSDLDDLILENKDLLSSLEKSPKKSGYPGLKHVKRNNGRVFDLLPVLYGSQGTLGIISEVILRLEVLPPRPHRLLAVFNSFRTTKEFLDYAKTLNPLELNFYDLRLVKSVEDFGKKPELLSKKFDEGFLVLVSFNDKSRVSRKKIKKCLKFLPKNAYTVTETLKNSDSFAELSSMLSSFLNDSAKGERVPLANDFYLPETSLPDFLSDLKSLEKDLKLDLALFGSFSSNNYSLRPDFKLDSLDDRRKAMNFLKSLNDLLEKSSGSLNGGLPEGRIRAIISNPTLPKEEKALYEKVKEIFDENHILAPDIKLGADTRATIRALRSSPLPKIIS